MKIDLDYQEESRLQLKMGTRRAMSAMQLDFLDHHLLCPCPMVNAKKKL